MEMESGQTVVHLRAQHEAIKQGYQSAVVTAARADGNSPPYRVMCLAHLQVGVWRQRAAAFWLLN
eukprot:701428-Pelagomonas_calceolata.AAC.2